MELIDLPMKHYLKPVHVYVTALEQALREIGEEVCSDESSADVVWVPFDGSYTPNITKQKIVYCWHGGHHFNESCRVLESMPPTTRFEINILCKKKWEAEWIQSRFPEVNVINFLAKYSGDKDLFQVREKYKGVHEYEFVFINNNNNAEINKAILEIEKQFPGSLITFGAGTANGFIPDVEVFPKAKFTLFIKPGGYICNSVTRSIISGVPVAMTNKRYHQEYADHYPSFLFLLGESIDDCICMARDMADADYLKLRSANILYADIELSKYKLKEKIELKSFIINLLGLRSRKKAYQGDPFFDLINDPCMENFVRLIEGQYFSLHSELAAKFLAYNFFPDNKWARIAKAHLLSRVGHTAEAVEILNFHPCEDADILVALIDIHIRARNVVDALQLANMAISKFPSHPWINKLHKQISG